MIQFNLLPDVKLAYIRAERQKRVISTAAIIAIIASLVVLAFLVTTVKLIQPKTINDLGNDIVAATDQLQDVEDIDKILTVQSQLGALTGLHDEKVVADRTFGYMYQLTPATVGVSDLLVDFTTNTMTITGSAPDLFVVNRFVDTLKFTVYQLDESVAVDDAPAVFGSVVLAAFNPPTEDAAAQFTIVATFDPAIFASEHETIRIVVPSIVTTRAQVERPTALFQPMVEGTEEGQFEGQEVIVE